MHKTKYIYCTSAASTNAHHPPPLSLFRICSRSACSSFSTYRLTACILCTICARVHCVTYVVNGCACSDKLGLPSFSLDLKIVCSSLQANLCWKRQTVLAALLQVAISRSSNDAVTLIGVAPHTFIIIPINNNNCNTFLHTNSEHSHVHVNSSCR